MKEVYYQRIDFIPFLGFQRIQTIDKDLRNQEVVYNIIKLHDTANETNNRYEDIKKNVLKL